MQINNFYTDPFPSVRNPLDSIVLSPHTIKTNDIALADPEKDFSDYQSVLPSISACEYHNQETCSEPKTILICLQVIFRRVFKDCKLASERD